MRAVPADDRPTTRPGSGGEGAPLAEGRRSEAGGTGARTNVPSVTLDASPLPER